MMTPCIYNMLRIGDITFSSSDHFRPKYAGIWWSRVKRWQLVKDFEVRDFLESAPGRTRMLAQTGGGKNDRDEPIRTRDDVKAINSILNGQSGLQGRPSDITKRGNLPFWGSLPFRGSLPFIHTWVMRYLSNQSGPPIVRSTDIKGRSARGEAEGSLGATK